VTPLVGRIDQPQRGAPNARAHEGHPVALHFLEIAVPDPRVARPGEIPSVGFRRKVIGAHREKRLAVARKKILLHAQHRTGRKLRRIFHPHAVLIGLAPLAVLHPHPAHGIEAGRKALGEWRFRIQRARNRNRQRLLHHVPGYELQPHLARQRLVGAFPPRVAQVDHRLGRLSRLERGKRHLDRERGYALPRIAGRLRHQGDAVRRSPRIPPPGRNRAAPSATPALPRPPVRRRRPRRTPGPSPPPEPPPPAPRRSLRSPGPKGGLPERRNAARESPADAGRRTRCATRTSRYPAWEPAPHTCAGCPRRAHTYPAARPR
jgi:hypothetical protein